MVACVPFVACNCPTRDVSCLSQGFIGQNTTPPVNEDDPYLNAFSFERYKDLYAFLVSPERQRLMRDLQVRF